MAQKESIHTPGICTQWGLTLNLENDNDLTPPEHLLQECSSAGLQGASSEEETGKLAYKEIINGVSQVRVKIPFHLIKQMSYSKWRVTQFWNVRVSLNTEWPSLASQYTFMHFYSLMNLIDLPGANKSHHFWKIILSICFFKFKLKIDDRKTYKMKVKL